MTDPEKIAQKKKRDIVIISILLVVFTVLFTKNVLFYKRKTSPPTSETNASESLSGQLVLVTNIRSYDKLRKERIQLWDRDWARDPFVPQQVTGGLVKAVNLTLKGILWDESKPKAVVNEKTLLEGDTIYGYTVVQIKPRSVILKTGEKNIELQVFHAVMNEPAAKS